MVKLQYYCYYLILSSLLLGISPKPVSGQQLLLEYTATVDSTVALSYMVQNKEGKILGKLNADKQIPSASIIKIPLLFYLMEKVEKNELDLRETYELRKSDKVGGSGELQFIPDGNLITYAYLASEMIRISDNTATNILIRKVGLKPFQEWLITNGYKATQLNRFMMDFDAITKGHQNYTSAAEMNKLLLSLLNEKSLNKGSTLQVLEWMENCEDNSALPNLLPEGVAIAHKTGTLEYVRGDAGIIFGKQPIVVTVFIAHYSNLMNADSIIAEIARLAYLDFVE